MAEESIVLLLNNADGTSAVGFTGESTAEFTSRALELKNDKEEKFIEGVVVEIEAQEGQPASTLEHVELYIGTANRLKDTPEWFGPFSLAQADEPVWFDLEEGIESKRYIFTKITDSQVTGIWELTAIEILGTMDGGRM